MGNFHLAICRGWGYDIPLGLFNPQLCAEAPRALKSPLKRAFCRVVFWARILPGNPVQWQTCNNFILILVKEDAGKECNVFGYWGHLVCTLSICFLYYWIMCATFFELWKMVWNDKTWPGMYVHASSHCALFHPSWESNWMKRPEVIYHSMVASNSFRKISITGLQVFQRDSWEHHVESIVDVRQSYRATEFFPIPCL